MAAAGALQQSHMSFRLFRYEDVLPSTIVLAASSDAFSSSTQTDFSTLKDALNSLPPQQSFSINLKQLAFELLLTLELLSAALQLQLALQLPFLLSINGYFYSFNCFNVSLVISKSPF